MGLFLVNEIGRRDTTKLYDASYQSTHHFTVSIFVDVKNISSSCIEYILHIFGVFHKEAQSLLTCLTSNKFIKKIIKKIIMCNLLGISDYSVNKTNQI